MCKAIRDLKEEGKEEGRNELKEEIVKTMSTNGFDIESIAKALNFDINYVKLVLGK